MGVGSGGIWIGVTFQTLERWPGCEYLWMSRIFSAYAVGAMLGPVLGAIDRIRGPFIAYLALLVAASALLLVMAPLSRASRRASRPGHGLRSWSTRDRPGSMLRAI